MNHDLARFVLTWVLYLALFPVSFFWLRRSWRIFIKKDYAEVALKKGEAPANPGRYAPFTGLTNLIGGGVAVWLAVTIPLGFYTFDRWIEIAGITLWMKIIVDFIISRQAHPFTLGRKKKHLVV